MHTFVSWSGGKDSCLAYCRALKLGLDISFLFTMLEENGLRSRSHGVPVEVLKQQAESLGVPIVFGKASWKEYEGEFRKVLKELKHSEGVEGGVFGDINLPEHKAWVEKVCNGVGVSAFEPLWNENYEKLFSEFLDSGFEAIIVNVKAGLVGEEWLGQRISWEFRDHLKNLKIDLFGENGEYHSLTVYGPTFKKRIRILKSQKTFRDGYCFLDISRTNLQ